MTNVLYCFGNAESYPHGNQNFLQMMTVGLVQIKVDEMSNHWKRMNVNFLRLKDQDHLDHDDDQ